MKLKIIFVIILSSIFNFCFAQTKLDRKAIPLNVDLIKLGFTFDVSYEMGVGISSKEYISDFTLKAKFNIDTNGNVINLKFDNYEFPLAIESITYKIMNTKKMWLPAIKNCQLTKSDSIIFIFIKQNIKEQKELIKEWESNKIKFGYYEYKSVSSTYTNLWGLDNRYIFNIYLREL